MKERNTRSSTDPRGEVRSAYGKIAKGGGSCCGTSSSCCGSPAPDAIAKGVGYTDNELAGLPAGANMGLSCGNPGAIAALKNGETVMDLGAGGGFDAFIAARKVGRSGRVIGVDMTPDMIEKARANAARFETDSGLRNVEFRLGEIENLPAADCSVDVILSNCVINLSPDKHRVWKESFRVLKPGGRVAVSDLALLKPLPEKMRESVEAYVGCVAGAVLVSETKKMLEKAGFISIGLESNPEIVEAMSDWSDPLYSDLAKLLEPGSKMSDYVTSLKISAIKPLK